jgi:hypothetical protein
MISSATHPKCVFHALEIFNFKEKSKQVLADCQVPILLGREKQVELSVLLSRDIWNKN